MEEYGSSPVVGRYPHDTLLRRSRSYSGRSNIHRNRAKLVEPWLQSVVSTAPPEEQQPVPVYWCSTCGKAMFDTNMYGICNECTQEHQAVYAAELKRKKILAKLSREPAKKQASASSPSLFQWAIKKLRKKDEDPVAVAPPKLKRTTSAILAPKKKDSAFTPSSSPLRITRSNEKV